MYQVVILDAIGDKAAILRSTLESRLGDLKLEPSRDVEFLNENDLDRVSPDSGKVGVLFSDGAGGRKFTSQVEKLLESSVVVIPAVRSVDDFALKVPDALQATNGKVLEAADPRLESVATLILEILGLLRKRRRLFISYKRSESAAVAQQLYHALDERVFDVFLDTLSVRPADKFQEQLWHRMADSDIVILLYTKSVHSSGWVEKEIDRANGMEITVLQMIWPEVPRDPKTKLFEPLYLKDGEFDPCHEGQLCPEKAASICTLVESLRAKSLARRQAAMTGTLRERAEKHGLTTAIQTTRYVDVYCASKTFTRVIPAIGVPDSETFQEGALAEVKGLAPKQIVLLYDALNITESWRTHLEWLHGYLPVKTVKALEVDQWLSGLCP